MGTMAFDGANNKYALGWFDGKVDIDPGPNTQILTSTGNGDCVVIKEDAGGNLVWVKQFPGLPPGSYGLSAMEIDVDAAGNVYIAGSVSDSVDLDPGPGVFRFNAGRPGSAFILKLDASGNFVWAKRHEVDTLTSSSFINGLK